MNDSLNVTSTIAQSAIATGTGIVLSQPDHTTQIVSIIVQIIALVGWWLRNRKK